MFFLFLPPAGRSPVFRRQTFSEGQELFLPFPFFRRLGPFSGFLSVIEHTSTKFFSSLREGGRNSSPVSLPGDGCSANTFRGRIPLSGGILYGEAISPGVVFVFPEFLALSALSLGGVSFFFFAWQRRPHYREVRLLAGFTFWGKPLEDGVLLSSSPFLSPCPEESLISS